jgi:hypothetical protein
MAAALSYPILITLYCMKYIVAWTMKGTHNLSIISLPPVLRNGCNDCVHKNDGCRNLQSLSTVYINESRWVDLENQCMGSNSKKHPAGHYLLASWIRSVLTHEKKLGKQKGNDLVFGFILCV